jgi:phosphatidylglycerol lysyltransferase
MAGALQLARPAFYRRTALTAALGSPRSLAAIATCIALAVWIGFFAYRHVDYQNDLWWQFAWNGDASRFLRATFAIAIMLVCFGVTQLFGHARSPAPAGDMDVAASAAALAHSPRTEALLALTGDKRFLRSPSGEALLMYQLQGQSWIVMGHPVGPKEEWADLLWRIREMADAAQGRLLLYQIGIEAMPIAIDLGLQLVKYGEEARVSLPGFTLDGADMKGLRHAERRALREGASFAIMPAADVPLLMSELRALSDGWLAAKGQAEKAFSVGRFDPAYMARFDCAVVRHEGRIVAFANVWATESREELSVDLMRHAETMPYGTMDFLFVQLMKWGKERGFRWFNLGLAPLSGIEARRLAPIWARIGGLLYRHGDALYSFEGLRAYKEKFAPVWEPRYIAAPHGLGLARALIDLQALVGGGRMSAAYQRKLALAA